MPDVSDTNDGAADALATGQRSTGSSAPVPSCKDYAVDNIAILVATWNVGNKEPQPAELEHWLPVGGDGYDLIVIGTQENAFKKEEALEDTMAPRRLKNPAGAVAGDAESSSDEEEDKGEVTVVRPRLSTLRQEQSEPRKEETESRRGDAESRIHATRHVWDLMCAERLGGAWTVLAHVVLRQMRLTIYASRTTAASVSHVVTARAATGVGGVIGNKGGLVVRLSIAQTTLAFCSCHLAAHEGAAHHQARNAMCRKILLKTYGGKMGGVRTSRQRRGHYGRPLDASHAVDHIFWLGDLNYRVELPRNALAAPTSGSTGSATGDSGLADSAGKAPPASALSPSQTAVKSTIAAGVAALGVVSSPPWGALSPTDKPAPKAAHVQAVAALVAAEEWDMLMRADGLRAAQRSGDAFVGFEEGPMHLPPTFKVRAPARRADATLTPRARLAASRLLSLSSCLACTLLASRSFASRASPTPSSAPLLTATVSYGSRCHRSLATWRKRASPASPR